MSKHHSGPQVGGALERFVGWFIRGSREGLAGVDPFDVQLEDDELLDEVELTSNLIVAANQSDRRLSSAEIDRILGVPPQAPRHRSA